MRALCVMTAYLLTVLLLFAGKQTAVAQSNRHLHADLAFNFVCKKDSRDAVERRMESFLKERDFRVLNLADIQRRYDVHLFDANMVALDSDQRMIDVRSIPGADWTYSFFLYSPPPTNHSFAFEADILSFVSENLKCQTRQIARSENGSEQKEFYDSQVRRVKGLFQEADRFRGGNGI